MLRIELKRSYSLAFLQGAAHAAAMVIAISVDLPVAAETALVIAIAASFVHALRGHALRTSDDAIIAIELRADGAAAVKIGKAGWHDARILGTTYVTPLLTVLNLKLDGYRIPRHVVILPDMVAGEDFRHLRVILRWQSERESTPTGGDSARSSGPSMRALP